MSCADVKCSSKNVSATLRKRCCSGGRAITPAKTGPDLSGFKSFDECIKKAGGGSGDLPIVKLAKGQLTDCIQKGNRWFAETSGIPNIDNPNPGQKKSTPPPKNDPPPEEDNDPDSDLREEDEDCTDFWSDIPIIGDLVPKKWREEGCRTGKSVTKGYENCAGIGIPCGELIILGLAVIAVVMVIK